MIVPCPACQTRFKLDPNTVPSGGVRFRCGQCRKLFRMTVRFRKPRQAAAPPAAARPAVPEAIPAGAQTLVIPAASRPPIEAARSIPVSAPAEAAAEPVPVQARPAAAPAARSIPVASAGVRPAGAPVSPNGEAPTRIPTPRSQELAHVTDIQRVARVAISDLELYDARRVEAAILGGKFTEVFRGDLDETRRLVGVRHRDVPDAVGLFDRTIEALCEQRRLKALAAK